jgi:uncharacterized protein (DUF2062 family)
MNPLLKYKPVAKLVTKTKSLLVSGNTPHQLSLAITLGIIFGVFPFLGVTTILLTIIAFIFRLNMVVVQLSNYVVYPLQLLLYLPFIRMGKFLGNLQSVSASEVFAIMKENWVNGIEKLWVIHAWAILAWALIALPVSYVIYRLLKNWIEKIKVKLRRKLKTNSPNSSLEHE